MRKFLILTIAALFLAAPAIPAVSGPLDDLKGEKRTILLFSKSRSEASLDRQISLFSKQRFDLDDRDTVVLHTVNGNRTMAVFGYARVSDGTGRQLTRLYEPERNGLTIVLIDKDGKEKGRWFGVTDPQIIFDHIDSVPSEEQKIETGTVGG
ncbi:MAG: DUF4174 domain-containing protein [Rhizobiaceae bacterium]